MAVALAMIALAAAGPAGAATWQAWLGEPSAAPAGTPKGATLNQVLPRSIKIRAGDRIRYSTHVFHTASYLPDGTLPPAVMPDPVGGKYTGIKDSTGASFWFEGLMKFIYNVAVFQPVGSPAVTRGSVHSTGAVFADESGTGSATLSFPQVGTFKMYCQLHPGMVQTVVVRPKKAKKSTVDTKVAVRTRVAREATAGWSRATAAAATPVPANSVFAGAESGQTTLLAFLPAILTVPAGTTVKWVNMAPSEVHNATFGPLDWSQAFVTQTDLLPLGPGAPNQASPVLIYGSEPPGPYVHTGSNHGNGFLAAPLTDDAPGDPPNGLPQSVSITFTRPGTYHYFCIIHGPEMSGDIVVTG
jgi:plastocyanin